LILKQIYRFDIPVKAFSGEEQENPGKGRIGDDKPYRINPADQELKAGSRKGN